MGVSIWLIRVGLIEKVAFEQRCKGVKEIGHGDTGGKRILDGRTISTLDTKGIHT